MKKKIFIFSGLILLLIAFFCAGFFVPKSQAIIGLSFGGHEVAWIPCTCSGALWIYYLPATPLATMFPGGALAYVPYATFLYSYYNVVTKGVWHLGTYLPGVQSCWMDAFIGCFPLPVRGTETKVGTSLLPTLL